MEWGNGDTVWGQSTSLKGLASARANKRVLLFKVGTGERLYTFEAALPPNHHFPRVIERVAFDGKGARLAAAYAEGEFSIWDTSALLQ